MRNRDGFSLLELIITLSIIAIIAALGLPAMTGTMDQRQVSGAADQFRAAHALARASAMRYGHIARLHTDPQKFWVDVDTSGASQFSTVGVVRDVSTDGVRIATSASLFCFDARGIPVSDVGCQSGPASVTFNSTISGSPRSATLQITNLGSIVR
jgi:prepilin-type N-terminal cleavage/methylation domain-containing protein